MSKSNRIRVIAKKVRREVEQFVNYKAPHFNGADPHLSGWCGYGSVMLYQALTRAGFKPEISKGVGHWFVRCEGYLVDITSSQFGQGKVVVRNFEKVADGIRKNEYRRIFWKEIGVIKNPKYNNVLSKIIDHIDDSRRFMIDKIHRM